MAAAVLQGHPIEAGTILNTTLDTKNDASASSVDSRLFTNPLRETLQLSGGLHAAAAGPPSAAEASVSSDGTPRHPFGCSRRLLVLSETDSVHYGSAARHLLTTHDTALLDSSFIASLVSASASLALQPTDSATAAAAIADGAAMADVAAIADVAVIADGAATTTGMHGLALQPTNPATAAATIVDVAAIADIAAIADDAATATGTHDRATQQPALLTLAMPAHAIAVDEERPCPPSQLATSLLHAGNIVASAPTGAVLHASRSAQALAAVAATLMETVPRLERPPSAAATSVETAPRPECLSSAAATSMKTAPRPERFPLAAAVSLEVVASLPERPPSAASASLKVGASLPAQFPLAPASSAEAAPLYERFPSAPVATLHVLNESRSHKASATAHLGSFGLGSMTRRSMESAVTTAAAAVAAALSIGSRSLAHSGSVEGDPRLAGARAFWQAHVGSLDTAVPDARLASAVCAHAGSELCVDAARYATLRHPKCVECSV